MGKIIVPKNHITTGTTNHTSTISTTSAILNANIAPEFLYIDDGVIIDRTIKYTAQSNILSTTGGINYRVNLFDSTSTDNKEVRFIKLTLTGFPSYMDNRTGSNLVSLSVSIKIYKKPSTSDSNYDCNITKIFPAMSNTSVNGTYWLTFNTSTKKYDVTKVSGIASPSTEPSLIYKAIVPQQDDWMNLNTSTQYSPAISTSMSINTGDFCNQPYIGRSINIYNMPSSATTISTNTTYNLRIYTEDKILVITDISLGKFIGPMSTDSTAAISPKLTFKIFINSNSTAVYTKTITISATAVGKVPITHTIGVTSLYIDVENNKQLDSLYKAIDAF